MIDHCMATHDLEAKGFNVQIMDDVDDFSDHRPLNITLSCSILTTDVFAESKRIYAKWNDDTKACTTLILVKYYVMSMFQIVMWKVCVAVMIIVQ